jgi:hypothetical protein
MKLASATNLDRNSGERTPDSCYAALDMIACAAFCKESRMKLVNAIELNRNPGAAEGSAVPLSPKRRPSK